MNGISDNIRLWASGHDPVDVDLANGRKRLGKLIVQLDSRILDINRKRIGVTEVSSVESISLDSPFNVSNWIRKTNWRQMSHENKSLFCYVGI
jgi:hypothetical protein